ncbi:MAG TPA: hypothetical protein VFK09_09210 [Gemmatimonadales bacterium]|jgi:hypothetical protein|nr:hypothetical protein [Gemmatimonadales bacterium]
MDRVDLSVGDEGTYVGAIGAAVVALWFLVIDTIAGVPLRTPSVLGQVLLFGRTRPVVTHADFSAVVAYTAVHVAAFLAFGFVLVALVRWAAREPVVRYALLQLLLVFELFVYGLLSLASEATRELFPFWTVFTANTLAIVAMGAYLWYRHPAVRRVLRETPLGDAPLR